MPETFCATFDGVDYTYRALTIEEIQFSHQIQDETELEDHFVNLATLEPEINWDKIKAGIVTQLAELIMSVSGILDLESITGYLGQTRDRISTDVISIMKAYILAAMPAYTLEELDSLTIRQMIDRVVLSEQILTLQQAIMGIESDGVKIHIVPVDQEEPKASGKSQKRRTETKEDLLRKIHKSEAKTVDQFAPGTERRHMLNDLDEDLLEKMVGQADSQDPIAAKLFGKR